MNKDFWDERFGSEPGLYGQLPSSYLAKVLSERPIGKALFIAEGQGRNAIYAAKLGWDVVATDSSLVARNQALEWAQHEQVKIEYMQSDSNALDFPPHAFDLIALIYAHQPTSERKQLYSKFQNWLKPGGCVVLEGFTKAQLGRKSGGPQNPDWLYEPDDMSEFAGLAQQELKVEEVNLEEGSGHVGLAAVVRGVFTN